MPSEIFVAGFTVAVLVAVFVGAFVVDACKLQRMGLLGKNSKLAADCQEQAHAEEAAKAA